MLKALIMKINSLVLEIQKQKTLNNSYQANNVYSLQSILETLWKPNLINLPHITCEDIRVKSFLILMENYLHPVIKKLIQTILMRMSFNHITLLLLKLTHLKQSQSRRFSRYNLNLCKIINQKPNIASGF